MSDGIGFGWRLVAFDPETRTGEVSLGDWRYPFDAAAAGDEDLRVGDRVFVRLQPSTSAPHVACVWPCVARLRSRPELPLAPELDEPATALRAVGRVPTPVDLVIIDDGGGGLSIPAYAADSYPYCGPLGIELTVHGALICSGARATPAVTVAAVSVRLALADERAVVHAEQALTGTDVVIALVEARDQLSAERNTRVVLVTCEEVTWQPGPSREQVRAVEDAFARTGLRSDELSAVIVDGASLVAICGDMRRPLVPVSAAEAAVFGPWCDALTSVLRRYEE